ncbi:MAG TPA: ABC transporter, partial [bacterium]|nr:ABC transporter [bacterium]
MSWKYLKIIFKRELKSFFTSPIAYIVITLYLVVTGWFFFSTFFLAGRADMRDFFSLLPFILSFTVPAVTMRLFAEEYRSGSYEILATLPVRETEILLGKYFAALAFVGIMILPTLTYPVFISFTGELDWGPVAGGYIGALLLAAGFSAIGLFASSLTKNQVIAFVISVAICFFLTIADNFLILLPTFLQVPFQYISAQ